MKSLAGESGVMGGRREVQDGIRREWKANRLLLMKVTRRPPPVLWFPCVVSLWLGVEPAAPEGFPH